MLDIRNSFLFSGIERNLSIFYLARHDIKEGVRSISVGTSIPL
jgi:hypothetical protein